MNKYCESNIIDNQSQLSLICNKIREGDYIAIDTEFVRRTTYYPILSLIQINVAEDCFVIDMLSDKIDIKPFLYILSNPKIYKIIHCLRQDVEIFFYLTKQMPNSLIDTQIMSNFCGFNYNISYSHLVKEILDKELPKDLQNSNWLKRPLSKGQIRYALNDVKYLLKIYSYLYDKLKSTRKLEWFKQEMNYVLNKNYDIENNSNLYKKFSLVHKSEIQKRNLQLLLIWRDNVAKKLNKPRSFIMKDDIVSKIVYENLDTYRKIDDICSLNNIRMPVKLRKEIISILKTSSTTNIDLVDESRGKISYKLNDKQNSIYKKSLAMLKDISILYKVEEEFIISHNDLKAIISGKQKMKDILFGWRKEIFEEFLKLIIEV